MPLGGGGVIPIRRRLSSSKRRSTVCQQGSPGRASAFTYKGAVGEVFRTPRPRSMIGVLMLRVASCTCSVVTPFWVAISGMVFPSRRRRQMSRSVSSERPVGCRRAFVRGETLPASRRGGLPGLYGLELIRDPLSLRWKRSDFGPRRSTGLSPHELSHKTTVVGTTDIPLAGYADQNLTQFPPPRWWYTLGGGNWTLVLMPQNESPVK